MNWFKILGYLLNVAIATTLFAGIYAKVTDLSNLHCWSLGFATFLAIYYSCKTVVDDSRSDTK